MAKNNHTVEIGNLTKEAKERFAACASTSETHLKRATDLGETFDRAWRSGHFKTKGALDKWSTDIVGVKKSWRHLCMVLYRDRAVVPTARKWAISNDIAAATASDIYKLLPRWKRRDDTASFPSVARRKSSLDFTDAQKDAIAAKLEIFANESNSPDERDQAELWLRRLADYRRVLTDRLLKKVGLQVHPSWADRSVDEMLREFDLVDSEAALEPLVSQNPECVSEQPEPVQRQASSLSGLPDGSHNVSLAADEAGAASRLEDETNEQGSRYCRKYSLKDTSSKSPVGERRAREALEVILELNRHGHDAETISLRLRANNLSVSAKRVRDILQKEGVENAESPHCIAVAA